MSRRGSPMRPERRLAAGASRVLRLVAPCSLVVSMACHGAGEVSSPVDVGALEVQLDRLGALQTWQSPDPLQLRPGQRSDRPLPIYRALMERPVQATARLDALADDALRLGQSVHDHILRLSRLAGAEVRRPARRAGPDDAAGVTLEHALERLALVRDGRAWALSIPDDARLPAPLRAGLASALLAFGEVERFRQVALAEVPSDLKASRLMGQVIDGELSAFASPDFRAAIGMLEMNALFAGMQDLVSAVERLVATLASADLPPLAWQLETPMGVVMIDTTGQDNLHVLDDVLLVVDTGGDDQYVFREAKPAPGISVLVDLEGDDAYRALTAAVDPSAAVLGYGVIWDLAGDDRYTGERLTQAAALFGVALLVDEAGDDRYDAEGFAQAFALGGGALLLDRAGDDGYRATTHAQASAGPQAAALLIEGAGDDDYHLLDAPLTMPSPQNPARNVSMGQGAGWGWRADVLDGRSLAGGFGALLDAAGDDRYRAEVFAQGVGYWQGAGLLVDAAGHNHFDVAWYGLGAAAHTALGAAFVRGAGGDSYRVRDNAGLAAANDRSIALFRDADGNDRYQLEGMGLAAVLDHGLAIFEDTGGADHYTANSPECEAAGQHWTSAGRTSASWLPAAAVFLGAPHGALPSCHARATRHAPEQ